MSEFPRYDRYPAAILADTQHLTLAEHGAYNRLLDTMWLQKARLPNDPKMLGRIVHASNHNWPRIWEHLKELFTVSDDGKWITQKRMSEEFEKACARQQTQRDNVDQRWGKSVTGSGKKAATSAVKKSASSASNPLENNNQGHTTVYAPRARASRKQEAKGSNEPLIKGGSLNPSRARTPAREKPPPRPPDPNCAMLLEAEAEAVEQARRAQRMREKLKAAGFIGLRIMPQ